MSDAILVTIAGMSLVFGAIMLIWLLMLLLVRYTTPVKEPEVDNSRQRRAAATAIAAALELQAQDEQQPNIPPPPPTAIISAWQAVMRQNQLQQRGPR